MNCCGKKEYPRNKVVKWSLFIAFGVPLAVFAALLVTALIREMENLARCPLLQSHALRHQCLPLGTFIFIRSIVSFLSQYRVVHRVVHFG